MKRTEWVIAAIVAGAAACVGGTWCSQPTRPPDRRVPTLVSRTNDAGDPAFVDFENHVPCAIDDRPRRVPRVKFSLVLYHDRESKDPRRTSCPGSGWG